MAASQQLPPLRERFANPPNRFRMLPIIHNLPEAPTAQDALLTSLTERGFGGMVTNVPFKDYLKSEPMWQVFTRATEEAHKRGMAMWLYDEHGYPSGLAGGQTTEGHPEWVAEGIYVTDAASKGGAVALGAGPGELLRAAAYPVDAQGNLALDKAVDLAAQVKDGKLAWQAPAGDWRVMILTRGRLYEGTHAAVSPSDKLPYINLLMAEPTKRFLEVTHDAYAARLGDKLGRHFIATFTDEPSLMSMAMRPQEWRPLPWSPGFAAEFKRRRGYAIEPLLPALAAPAGAEGAKARHDFWLTVGELVAENYFGQIRDWCRAHGIPSGGHLLLEEPLLTHVADYGDLFRCERNMDAPSLDCLTSLVPRVHWHSARLIASAGELEGRYDNMCETSDHQERMQEKKNATEDQIRGTCNRLIVSGITCITSYYSFQGLDQAITEAAPDITQMDRNAEITDIKTASLRRLNDWIGRCCAMLYGGPQVTDVAVAYPIETAWTRYEPARMWTQDCPEPAKQVERIWMKVSEELFMNQRDFTYVDARTLAEATVDKGALNYRHLSWRVVVLPCVDTLPLKAWQNLAAFWKSGGVVVAVGARPLNSEAEFPSDEARAISRELFGAGEGANRSAGGGVAVYLAEEEAARLPEVLGRLIEPEVKCPAGAPLRVTHRRIEGQEVFFVINDSDQPWSGKVDVAAVGAGELFDPATGAVTPLAGPEGVALELGVYGGALLRFDRAKAPARLDGQL